MNYLAYYPIDMINGQGTRATLFVSGCEHKCKDCYNAVSWNQKNGSFFSQDMEDKIINDLKDTNILRQGLSISGGDPLFFPNLKSILKLVKRVKLECLDKDIWMWTGYKIEDLTKEQKEIINYIDVLIDGKFEVENKDKNLKWRGSSNQRLIYLKNI